jgi:hypothetical protein
LDYHPEKVCPVAGSWKHKAADRTLGAVLGAASRITRGQPVSSLKKSDRLAGRAQRAIVNRRPYRRQSPVGGTFGTCARLDQNPIDPFKPVALFQGAQTYLLKLHGRPNFPMHSFIGHCVSSVDVLKSPPRTKSSIESFAARIRLEDEFRP